MRKNLANCDLIEFAAQAYRIKSAVEKWIKDTGILTIRSKKAEGIEIIPPDASDDEKAEIQARNRKKISDQLMKNASEIFDAIFKDHPKETMELIALTCFVEPEHIRDHKTAWYLASVGEMLADTDVLDFFTSLAQLEQTGFLRL